MSDSTFMVVREYFDRRNIEISDEHVYGVLKAIGIPEPDHKHWALTNLLADYDKEDT